MTLNYIGLVILLSGVLFLAIAVIQPEKFIVYKILKARSTVCFGDNAKWMLMAYGVMIIVFGLLLMLRVFGKQQIDTED